VGMHDLLHPDPKNVLAHQREDMLALARLLMALSCRKWSAILNPLHKSLEVTGCPFPCNC
jgi:hypothetical protein